jgi:HEAT repeat protein
MAEEETPRFRRAALGALSLVKGKGVEVVDPLRRFLGDPDPAVRGSAATNLGILGEKAQSALPELTRCLQDNNFSVRIAAIEALAVLGPQGQAAIAPQLADREHRIRGAVASAMRKSRTISDEARGALRRAQTDESAYVREEATRTLETLAARSQVEAPPKDPGVKAEPLLRRVLSHVLPGH